LRRITREEWDAANRSSHRFFPWGRRRIEAARAAYAATHQVYLSIQNLNLPGGFTRG
jgi:hypothetical protein